MVNHRFIANFLLATILFFMAVRTIHDQKDTAYFITITCYEWLSLIEKTNLYDFIYTWFGRIHKQGIKTIGYVIMPNHLHLLIYFPEIDTILNKIIGEAKRFMAYEIIKRLKEKGDFKTLNFLKQDYNAYIPIFVLLSIHYHRFSHQMNS